MGVNPKTIDLIVQLTLTLANGVVNGRIARERIEAVVGTAQKEGRKVTLEELRALAAETDTGLDELDAMLAEAEKEDPQVFGL